MVIMLLWFIGSPIETFRAILEDTIEEDRRFSFLWLFVESVHAGRKMRGGYVFYAKVTRLISYTI